MSDAGNYGFEWFELITKALNSSFGTALAGAFFGAVAANYFAIRTESRQALTERLLAGNAATSFSIAIFQHALGFKDQMYEVLVEDYFRDRERYMNFVDAKLQSPTEEVNFVVQYNFGSVPAFRTDADRISELIALKAGAAQKVLMAASTLQQVVDSLARCISARNEQLALLSQQKDSMNDDEFARAYFGVEDSEGNIDVRLFEAVKGLQHQLDDTIFFSKYIAQNLAIQNEALAMKIGKSSPPPTKLIFDQERVAQLLPDEMEYPDWLD
ncbi:hypothetical protein [Roseobacter weihaiensis]|uniref:hypothetical protein n=1 Tax=Roseobacter weihaiensis TaxID=2763262 RepID=UPI001D0A69B5|nr:hypothetical protein [Roseobacter sp. H9]